MATTIPHVTVTRRPDGGGYVIRCTSCLQTFVREHRSAADVKAHSHTLEHTRQQAIPEDQVL